MGIVGDGSAQRFACLECGFDDDASGG